MNPDTVPAAGRQSAIPPANVVTESGTQSAADDVRPAATFPVRARTTIAKVDAPAVQPPDPVGDEAARAGAVSLPVMHMADVLSWAAAEGIPFWGEVRA